MSITDTCTILECDQLPYTRTSLGYCGKHWAKYKKYGDATYKKISANKRNHPLFITWHGMKMRCYQVNHEAYKHYGGRGIKVCDRWLDSFNDFVEDVGEKPSKYHSLDRIDNDGDYEPSNCRWVTPDVQAVNTRVIKNSPVGVFQRSSGRWGTQLVRKGKTYRPGTFDTIEEAIKARRDYARRLSY